MIRNMPPANRSLNERLTAAVTDLAGLLERLEAEVPHKRRPGFGAGGSPSKGGHRPLAAWNSAAAMLIMDVHAGIRQLEKELQQAVSGSPRPRGGAGTVTAALIQSIPGLCAGADNCIATRAARQLESWCWRARLVLGEQEPWRQLPRVPGQAAPRCPWCRFATLRYKPLVGVLRCINPACKDEEGNKPLARVEFGPVSGEPLLMWQDSTSGVPTGGTDELSAERMVVRRPQDAR